MVGTMILWWLWVMKMQIWSMLRTWQLITTNNSPKKVSLKVMIFMQHQNHLDNNYAEDMFMILTISRSNRRVLGSVQKVVSLILLIKFLLKCLSIDIDEASPSEDENVAQRALHGQHVNQQNGV